LQRVHPHHHTRACVAPLQVKKLQQELKVFQKTIQGLKCAVEEADNDKQVMSTMPS